MYSIAPHVWEQFTNSLGHFCCEQIMINASEQLMFITAEQASLQTAHEQSTKQSSGTADSPLHWFKGTVRE